MGKPEASRFYNCFSRWQLLLMLLWLGALMTFAVTGMPGGLDTDSCNYAVVAKEILRSHHWLGLYDPVIESVFYYHFPFTIWVTAVIFKLFGISSFTAKLFSMLCGLGLVTVVYYLGKVLKNQWVGFFGALSLLMTGHITRLAMQCRMDIPVTFFISLAILTFILSQKYSRYYYLLFGLSVSLAILTKDVIGLFPLAIVFIYLALGLRWKEFFHPLFLAGLLVAAAPVGLWIWLDKGVLIKPWFSWNFLHLLSSPSFKVPWYYYIWALGSKYYYFLPFALYGGHLAVKEVRRNKQPEFLLLVVWALIFPVAFSFAKQKLHYFILPMYPAAALLVGLCFEKILKEGAKVRAAIVFKYLLLLPTIALLFFPLNLRSKHFKETVALAPVLDRYLKELPEYDFMVYHQDAAALLFYSRELSRVKRVDYLNDLEEKLKAHRDMPLVCYISEVDYRKLSVPLQEEYRAALKCKDKLIIVSANNFPPTVTLPE